MKVFWFFFEKKNIFFPPCSRSNPPVIPGIKQHLQRLLFVGVIIFAPLLEGGGDGLGGLAHNRFDDCLREFRVRQTVTTSQCVIAIDYLSLPIIHLLTVARTIVLKRNI